MIKGEAIGDDLFSDIGSNPGALDEHLRTLQVPAGVTKDLNGSLTPLIKNCHE